MSNYKVLLRLLLNCMNRVGYRKIRLGLVWQKCIFSRIQFTKPFIELDFVETNQLFDSNPNVILMQQTYNQRSSMTDSAANHVFKSEVATAQRHSLCKSRSHAQTLIWLTSTFQYQEHIANSYGKTNASAGHLLLVAMLVHWPQVCRVKITFRLLLTIWFVSTKMNSMKGFVNWIPLNVHVSLHQTQTYLNQFIQICTNVLSHAGIMNWMPV